MAKQHRKSRILDAVLETATDLHQAGLLSDEQLTEYQELCTASEDLQEPSSDSES